MKYSYNGQKLNHQNIHAFLTELARRNIIPYDSSPIETDTEITWNWRYKSIWSWKWVYINCDARLSYDKKTGRYAAYFNPRYVSLRFRDLVFL